MLAAAPPRLSTVTASRLPTMTTHSASILADFEVFASLGEEERRAFSSMFRQILDEQQSGGPRTRFSMMKAFSEMSLEHLWQCIEMYEGLVLQDEEEEYEKEEDETEAPAETRGALPPPGLSALSVSVPDGFGGLIDVGIGVASGFGLDHSFTGGSPKHHANCHFQDGLGTYSVLGMELPQGGIMGGEANITTLMIRNLPRSLTQRVLLSELDTSGFADIYDFVYMPCSFEHREAKGFAFVNLIDPLSAEAFASAWHRSHRCGIAPGDAPLNLSPAVVQGFEANVRKWASARMNRVRNPDLRPFVRGALNQKGGEDRAGCKGTRSTLGTIGLAAALSAAEAAADAAAAFRSGLLATALLPGVAYGTGAATPLPVGGVPQGASASVVTRVPPPPPPWSSNWLAGALPVEATDVRSYMSLESANAFQAHAIASGDTVVALPAFQMWGQR